MIREYSNTWIYDEEVFFDCFTMVARLAGTKKYKRFVIHETRNDYEEMVEWIVKEKPTLVGFNNNDFDAQVLTYIIREEIDDAKLIYEFSQKVIESLQDHSSGFKNLPYRYKELICPQIDLYKICHYDNNARRTSLKWLEFTMRAEKVKDLPMEHGKSVSKSGVNKLLSYNRVDVDNTHLFFEFCEQMVLDRVEMASKYGNKNLINMPNSSIGSWLLRSRYAKATNQNYWDLKKGTDRQKIKFKKIIFDYVEFKKPEFQEVLEWYQSITMKKEEGKDILSGFEGKTIEFGGLEIAYGVGGLHAAFDKGVYESSDNTVIVSIDVASYYPNLSIKNKIYPKHLGPEFCEVYEEMYLERKTHAKGTVMNKLLKIALNGSFGKMGTGFDQFLRDHRCLASITVNGQLLLSMLAETLSDYGQILLLNTDGLEMMISRDDYDKVMDICKKWEELTQLTLEYEDYKKLVIKDVNNYIAVSEKGKVKQKGLFVRYEDLFSGEPDLHRNPSSSIIASALTEYFVNGTSVKKFIKNHDNIHDFLIAIKKQKSFEYWIMHRDDSGYIDIERSTERVLRYYVASGGGSMYKHFNDNRKNMIQAVNKGETVESAMIVVNDGAFENKKGEPLYENLNYDYYINKALEIIKEIEE